MANNLIRFTLRITKEEEKKISILSKKLKLKKAEVIRSIIDISLSNIEEEIKVKKELAEEYQKLAFQLKKIGTVLNESNRKFYENSNPKIEEVEKGIDELWQFLRQSKE